jgi:hypothetical protein
MRLRPTASDARCWLLPETQPLELLAGQLSDGAEVLVVVKNREARQLGGRRDQYGR